MRWLTWTFIGGLVVACVGCESPPPPQATASSESAPLPPEPEAPPPEKTPEQLAAEAAAVNPEKTRREAVRQRAIAARKAAEAKAAPAGGEEMKKAEVGVGVKGKDYGGPGFITTPVEAYFTTQDRIAFEIQIPNAMKIYKAAHNNKGPKTHQEYMDVIIKENGVSLPELKPGEEYLYNPETEELMVRAPKTDS